MPLAAQVPSSTLVTVSTLDYLRGVGVEVSHQELSLGSAAWPSANLGISCPLYLEMGGLVVKLFVANGSTVNGNMDVGLYTAAYAKIVAIGATAQAGTSDLQAFDITDTYVGPGQYYLIASSSSGTATTVRAQNNLNQMRAWGVTQMAAAHALPATFVPATVGQGYLPLMGLTLRTVV